MPPAVSLSLPRCRLPSPRLRRGVACHLPITTAVPPAACSFFISATVPPIVFRLRRDAACRVSVSSPRVNPKIPNLAASSPTPTLQLTSRRFVDGRTYVMLMPHMMKGAFFAMLEYFLVLTFLGYESCDRYICVPNCSGKSVKSIYRHCKQKQRFLIQRLTPLATSEGQSYSTEFDGDNFEPDKLILDNQDHLLRNDLSFFTGRSGGKPGFISFHGNHYLRMDEVRSTPVKETSTILWFAGPTILVAFLVLPSFYLRRVLSTFFEDSLLTDFLILFFTEALFYTGVAIFVFLVDFLWRPLQQREPQNYVWSKTQKTLRVTSVVTLVLTLITPLLTMGLVWPWTGPAASATLAPYLVGIVVQFAFEQYARYKKSPAWAVIPIIFQIYRLHQLNRAAQLVAALSFSVRGAETTSYTMAISNSLGTLLTVLQILGIICVWSLSSFLMRFLPPSEVIL